MNRRLVEQILEKPEQELKLGGRRTDAAVLFADLVGFTRRCEQLTPEAVVEDLNTWFSVVDPIIHAHGGIIDKRIGDAVMVVFVPREGEDRSNGEIWSRAIRCGLAMQSAMSECHRALAQRRAEPMDLRVGIAGGELDDMDQAPMADVTGTIATFTVDHLVYSQSPPVVFAVVDFDGGGRMPIELTDVDTVMVAIGDQVEMTFRRMFTADGLHNYFWKARPVGG